MKYLLLILAAFAAMPSYAATTYNIYASDTSGAWDCTTGGGSANPVDPGDTILLHAHNSADATTVYRARTNRIWFQDCIGTSASPITIKNDPADSWPVEFKQTTTNLGSPSIRLIRSDWVTLDGTGGWVGSGTNYCGYPAGRTGCGIRILAQTEQRTNYPTMWVQGNFDFARNANRPENYDGNRGIVIKGIEIDGANAIPTNGAGAGNTAPWPGGETGRVGIYMHHAASQVDSPKGLTTHPGAWREDMKVTRNYIHDVFGEAIYFGNNTTAVECNDEYCVPMRGMEISYNLVENCGRDCINPKMWLEGTAAQPTNTIHHNYIADCAFRLEDWEQPCLAINSNSVDIYNNIIVRPRGEGINYGTRADQTTNTANWQSPGQPGQFDDFEPYQGKIYNNVIYRAGDSDTFYEALAGTSPQRIDPASAYAPASTDEAAINVFLQDQNTGTILIYNNTIVASDGFAVNYADLTPVEMAMNNIFAQDGNTSYVNTAGTFISDNYSGSIAGAGLVSPTALDFALISSSVNIDTANSANQGTVGDYSSVSPVPSTDLADAARPQNSLYDKGAYEYFIAAPPVPTPIRIVRGMWE